MRHKGRHVKTDEAREVKTDGVFLAIGHIPNATLFRGQLDRNSPGDHRRWHRL